MPTFDHVRLPQTKCIRADTAPDGAVVIEVRRSRKARVPLWLRAPAAVIGTASTVMAVYFAHDGQIATIIVLGLIGVTMMGFLVWSVLVVPPARGTSPRLRAEWREQSLLLSGPDVPDRGLLPSHEVRDIRVDFDGGLDGATPNMRLTICRGDGTSMFLLPGQDAADLLWLAETLRRFVGLPSRTYRMAAWFEMKAAAIGTSPPQPAGAVPVLPVAVHPASSTAADSPQTASSQSRPVVPMLDYAGPQRIKLDRQGIGFTPNEMIVWLPVQGPYSAFISATVSRIQIVWHDAVVEFPSAIVYGACAGAGSDRAPPTLYLCTLEGVHGMLAGVPAQHLWQAACLLNDLLGVEGSVHGIDTMVFSSLF